MDDANDNPVDTSASEYAKNYNLPNEQIDSKASESRLQELQSIRNKLFDYKIKKAEFIKKQAELVKPVSEPTAPQKVYTKEEAEKNVAGTSNKNSNEAIIDNNIFAEKQAATPVQPIEPKDTLKENLVVKTGTQVEQTKTNEVSMEVAAPAVAVTPLKQPIIETPESTPTVTKAETTIPDITNLSDRLKKESAQLPETPSPYKDVSEKTNTIPETSNNQIVSPESVEQNIISTKNTVAPASKEEEKIESTPSVINNIVTTAQSNQTPVPTQSVASEPISPPVQSTTFPEIATALQETAPNKSTEPDNIASKIQEPEAVNIPTPEQPGFAELYTKNLKTLMDNFAASISQTTNPAEASLNSIQIVVEGLARESTASTKQMAGMITRLCSAVENILRYLPNINAGNSISAPPPQLAQSYNDINTGLIDDTRSDFRKQYGNGIIDMANKRPTIPGFSI